MKTVSERIHDFFNENVISMTNLGIVVTRDDGVSIYSSLGREKNSYSALMAGIWQASKETIGLMSDKQNEQDFRLGFDTSSSGLFILPLDVAGKNFLFGAVFSQQKNPAQLKLKLRLLRDKLSYFLQNPEVEFMPKKNKIGERADFLFKDISDDEMDNLFSFAGE